MYAEHYNAGPLLPDLRGLAAASAAASVAVSAAALLRDTPRGATTPIARRTEAPRQAALRGTPPRSVLADAARQRATPCVSMAEALMALGALQDAGQLATLAPLGRPAGHSGSGRSAAERTTDPAFDLADACRDGLEALGAAEGRARLGLSATDLGCRQDLIDSLLARALALGVAVQFDAQAPDATDAALACARRAHVRHPDVGITLPGRWLRSRADADAANRDGLRVRVVKGLWADPVRPQYDERAGFLAVVDRLAGRATHVSIATHDMALARAALMRLCKAGTPCELELTHGTHQQAGQQLARSLNVPVRSFIAYGEACRQAAHLGAQPLAYWWSLRRAAARPATATTPASLAAGL